MEKKYRPLIITALVVIIGVGLVYIFKQKPALVDVSKSVTKQATDANRTAKEATVSAVVGKEQINKPLLKNSPSVPSVLPTPSFKSSFANIVLLSRADSETPTASGKVVVELYDIGSAPDPRAKLASFRMNGTVSGLNPNTAYWIGVYGTNGGGVGFLKFTTDTSGNAAVKIPRDGSYSGNSTGFTPDNPLSYVGVFDDKVGETLRPVLKGDFVIANNTISAK